MTRRIDQKNAEANIFYSILVVDRVRDIDKGQYTCHVKSGPSIKAVNTTVIVYGKKWCRFVEYSMLLYQDQSCDSFTSGHKVEVNL